MHVKVASRYGKPGLALLIDGSREEKKKKIGTSA